MTIEQRKPAIEYYYDTHLTEEDKMSDSTPQTRLVLYLTPVLKWQYRLERWFVMPYLGLHATDDVMEVPIEPDICVFIGVVDNGIEIASWRIDPPEYPAPTVVFEVASKRTWKDDLDNKPQKYATIGVQEYYAYDPNTPKFRRGSPTRLQGWQYVAGRALPMQPDAQGRLWSPTLDSWLVPDGGLLRLTDRDGNIRPLPEEAEHTARLISEAQADIERRARLDSDAKAQAAETQAEDERRARLIEQQARAEAEAKAAEAERQADIERRARTEADQQVAAERHARAEADVKAAAAEAKAIEAETRMAAEREALRARLRALGIDPEGVV